MARQLNGRCVGGIAPVAFRAVVCVMLWRLTPRLAQPKGRNEGAEAGSPRSQQVFECCETAGLGVGALTLDGCRRLGKEQISRTLAVIGVVVALVFVVLYIRTRA